KRTAAVELVIEPAFPVIDAVVGNAAQDGVADIGSPAIFDVAANRVAAPRIANQSHARGAGVAFQLLDSLAEFSALVFARGFVWLRLGVVGTCQWICKIDRKHAVARNSVGFHSPERSHPHRCVVAIAVYEQNRRNSNSALAGGR